MLYVITSLPHWQCSITEKNRNMKATIKCPNVCKWECENFLGDANNDDDNDYAYCCELKTLKKNKKKNIKFKFFSRWESKMFKTPIRNLHYNGEIKGTIKTGLNMLNWNGNVIENQVQKNIGLHNENWFEKKIE